MTRLVPAGHGEVVGDAPDRRVEILSDDDAVHATWSRFAAGRDGADLHVHHRHSDLFYVLEGELTVRLGPEGVATAVAAGTLARVPPLVVHGFRNASDAEERHLNLHAPGRGFADFMRARRDGRSFAYDQFEPPADGGRDPADAVIGGEEVVVERPGLRATLLADAPEIAIAEIVAQPRAAPAPHVHRDHVESLYVLDGELALTRGAREVRAHAGTWVQIPRDVPHAIGCDAPARFLELHTPGGGFGGYLRALHESGDPEAAARRASFDSAA